MLNYFNKKKDIYNTAWDIKDVTLLPYSDTSFSLVASRYSFHYIIDPSSVLNEMK
jgi:ubiquinone/menaquinone biosynthesis C-methylase UbiE